MNKELRRVSEADKYLEEIRPYLKKLGVDNPIAEQFIRQFKDYDRLRDYYYFASIPTEMLNTWQFKRLEPEAQKIVGRVFSAMLHYSIFYLSKNGPSFGEIMRRKNEKALSQQDA